MWISTVIIISVFLAIVVLLMLDKVSRTLLALCGAVICFFTLTFLEDQKYFLFVSFIFGTEQDGFANAHSLILIFSMSLIVQVCHKAGLFQFISLRLIVGTANRPNMLLFVLCTITVIISSLINNILTIMVIIPLTITVSGIINIDPEPLIITQAILVNMGGTFFTISSIPNILIVGASGITFIEFFLNVGVISIILYLFTVGLFYLKYQHTLQIPKDNIAILKELSPTIMISNKSLLVKSSSILGLVLILFFIIPSSILPLDIIALSGALILLIISWEDMDRIISEIDISLLIYLMGIFIMVGSLEYTNILEIIGGLIVRISGGNILASILLILWISGLLSANIDSIPITKVLIPTISTITNGYTEDYRKLANYALVMGANWGDNFTPMGDNMLVMNIAKKYKHPVRFKEFFKIGPIAVLFQLCIVTIIYGFLLEWIFGLIALIVFLLGLSVFLILRLNPRILQKYKIRLDIRRKTKHGNENSE